MASMAATIEKVLLETVLKLKCNYSIQTKHLKQASVCNYKNCEIKCKYLLLSDREERNRYCHLGIKANNIRMVNG
jgi:hypothetical protein